MQQEVNRGHGHVRLKYILLVGCVRRSGRVVSRWAVRRGFVALILVKCICGKSGVALTCFDTKDNLSDLMTKVLKRVTFNFLVNKLMHSLRGRRAATF